ncbi:hypothetical protein ACFE04_009389 [Oxalis oulophora]
MACCMKLGSKSEVFYSDDGQTWLCSSGLPTDVTVEIGETTFHLHKFPLLSRSGTLENLIEEYSREDERNCVLQLHDIPGGAETFLLIAKFCYGVKIELTPSNTEVNVVTRCINSLAMKACVDPYVFSWPMSGHGDEKSPDGALFWNGIRTGSTAKPQPVTEDWWYEDVSILRFPIFKRLILAVELRGIKSERLAGAVVHYAKKHLPLLGRNPSFRNEDRSAYMPSISHPSDIDERNLLEEIVELLPEEKGVTPTKFLIRLLRTSMILHAGPSCRENLEKRIGAQLDQAAHEDLLIPNTGYSVETLYDIDCVQRILDHFMTADRDSNDLASSSIVDDEQMDDPHSLTPMTMVANLVDGYLAEVAPDVNLKLLKFQSLAAVIPDYARPIDDGIYRAIDVYLKAHPWLTDSEREQLCRLMNCEKLSLEASTHAAQNERLPLRVIVQVLFFEQLRLRTSVAGWCFVTDNLETSQNQTGNLVLSRNNLENFAVTGNEMKERVSDLEKECSNMKEELEKLMKTKGTWNAFLKKLGLRLKLKRDQNAAKIFKAKTSSPPLADGKQEEVITTVEN